MPVVVAGRVSMHLKGVALVNEEGLPLACILHLVRVVGDERVEEGVEAAVLRTLGAQNAA